MKIASTTKDTTTTTETTEADITAVACDLQPLNPHLIVNKLLNGLKPSLFSNDICKLFASIGTSVSFIISP